MINGFDVDLNSIAQLCIFLLDLSDVEVSGFNFENTMSTSQFSLHDLVKNLILT